MGSVTNPILLSSDVKYSYHGEATAEANILNSSSNDKFFLPGTAIKRLSFNLKFTGFEDGIVTLVKFKSTDGQSGSVTLTTGNTIDAGGLYTFTILDNTVPGGSGERDLIVVPNPLGTITFTVRKGNKTKAFTVTNFTIPVYNLSAATKVTPTAAAIIGPPLTVNLEFQLGGLSQLTLYRLIQGDTEDTIENTQVPSIPGVNNKFRYSAVFNPFTPDNINTYIIFTNFTKTIFSTVKFKVPFRGTIPRYLNSNVSYRVRDNKKILSFYAEISRANILQSNVYTISSPISNAQVKSVQQSLSIRDEIEVADYPTSAKGVTIYKVGNTTYWTSWKTEASVPTPQS